MQKTATVLRHHCETDTALCELVGIANLTQIAAERQNLMAPSELPPVDEPCHNRRPNLLGLRTSGDVGAAADVVWFLHREDYCVTACEAEQQKLAANLDVRDAPEIPVNALNRPLDVAELIIAKQRDGNTGTILLNFDTTSTRFSAIARDQPLA